MFYLIFRKSDWEIRILLQAIIFVDYVVCRHSFQSTNTYALALYKNNLGHLLANEVSLHWNNKTKNNKNIILSSRHTSVNTPIYTCPQIKHCCKADLTAEKWGHIITIISVFFPFSYMVLWNCQKTSFFCCCPAELYCTTNKVFFNSKIRDLKQQKIFLNFEEP